MEPAPVGGFTRAVLAVTVVLILGLGLFPSRLVEVAATNGFRPYPYSPALDVGLPRLNR